MKVKIFKKSENVPYDVLGKVYLVEGVEGIDKLRKMVQSK